MWKFTHKHILHGSKVNLELGNGFRGPVNWKDELAGPLGGNKVICDVEPAARIYSHVPHSNEKPSDDLMKSARIL